MIIKSNTPLSDNELRRVRDVMQNRLLQTDLEFSFRYVFPGMRVKITDETLYIGNPPWDLTQEIET